MTLGWTLPLTIVVLGTISALIKDDDDYRDWRDNNDV